MLLTVLIPGLGHVYLRLWIRALLWLVLYVTTTTLLLPDGATPDGLSLDAFLAAGDAISLEVTALILGVLFICLVDAYMMANHVNRRVRQTDGDTPESCPHCRKELDSDLTFCHWCTTELDSRQK